MAVPSSSSSMEALAVSIPTVDLSLDKSTIPELILRACESCGIFKLVNHGFNKDVVTRLEQQGFDFFNKLDSDKKRAGPPNPFGYGLKNIGSNGDKGELEYLLLQTNPSSICEHSKAISDCPAKFSSAVIDYIEEVRELACEILNHLADSLSIKDKYIFSKLIRDAESDSMFRLNYYPAAQYSDRSSERVGFGEHCDPQILTILRSNDVAGLEVRSCDGLWVNVPPDPSSFFFITGDTLEAMTNGRLKSVRHRALANSEKARMSMMYFGAPPLNAWISPLPEMVSPKNPILYKPFTWSQYKNVAYSLRLGDARLDLFKIRSLHNRFIPSDNINYVVDS